MGKKFAIGGGFVVVCLAAVITGYAPSQAWQGQAWQEPSSSVSSPSGPPSAPSIAAPYPHPVPAPPTASAISPAKKPASTNPPTVSDLLAQLRQIKESQKALAEQELLVVKRIKSQLAAERQKIDAAEQEFLRIVPPPRKRATSGRVGHRFTVYSGPPGALFYLNNRYLGPTPVDGWIVNYGKQQFTLIKEGYETLNVVQEYPPPGYDWPGIDFIPENNWPIKLRDVRQFSYTLRPLQSIPPAGVSGP